MTYPEAKQKALALLESVAQVVIVAVEDRAHGNGEGEQRFDAVTADRYREDQKGERYMKGEEVLP